jgi:hypothetical protein
MLWVRILHASLKSRDVRRLLGHRGRAAESTRIQTIRHLAGVAPERVSGGEATTHHVVIRGPFHHASRNHFLHLLPASGRDSSWQGWRGVGGFVGASGWLRDRHRWADCTERDLNVAASPKSSCRCRVAVRASHPSRTAKGGAATVVELSATRERWASPPRLERRDMRRLLSHRGRAAEGTIIESIGHLAGVAGECVSGGEATSHQVLIGGTFYHALRPFPAFACGPPREDFSWQGTKWVDVVGRASG